MVVLSLDTATRAGSLALDDGLDLRAMVGDSDRTHGERLPLEIADWLASIGRSLRDVDLFAVLAGPGSFTGLRVGIATIQGLAFALHAPVIGIPTLEALASGWHAHDPSPALTVACLDGQRGDVFFAAWRTDLNPIVDGGTALIAPAVGTPDEAAAAVEHIHDEVPIVIVGSGGTKYSHAFARLGDVRIVEAPVPLAASAARLAAARRAQAGPPHAVRPIYIRRPDAVLARERLRT
jgi:tRNA threonylcarbamoyladenosine biosynthesis protein TsaB